MLESAPAVRMMAKCLSMALASHQNTAFLPSSLQQVLHRQLSLIIFTLSRLVAFLIRFSVFLH